MKRQYLVILVMFGFEISNSQTSKYFQEPTKLSGSCYGYGVSVTRNDVPCQHAGRDYCGSTKDEVVATGSGRVVLASNSCDGSKGPKDNRGLGKTVIIAHKTPVGEVYSLYAHLNSIDGNITPGKYIPKGTFLGYKGKTGGSAGENVHLHFEMKDHAGLGHRQDDCTGPGCVGYVKNTLLPLEDRGYFNPKNFINVFEYDDISLASRMPTTLVRNNLKVPLKIYSPFMEDCTVDLRLGLYSVSRVPLGEISYIYNARIEQGEQTFTFSKAKLSSPAAKYFLQLDYCIPGTNKWIPLPVNGSVKNPGPTTLQK